VPDVHSLGGDAELAGNFGLADTVGKQLGRTEPAGLEPVTFSLCRRAARDSWHPQILTRPAASLNSAVLLNPTPKSL
jgi:hypothetical protein